MTDQTKRRAFFKKTDLLLIGGLLLLFAALFLFLRSGGEGHVVAKVYQNDKLVREIELWQVKESFTIAMPTEPALTIQVEPGAIYVAHADCPDQICVHAGRLTKGRQTAVCLPARVAIVLEAQGDDVDATT